jgi:hypothetical protein
VGDNFDMAFGMIPDMAFNIQLSGLFLGKNPKIHALYTAFNGDMQTTTQCLILQQ